MVPQARKAEIANGTFVVLHFVWNIPFSQRNIPADGDLYLEGDEWLLFYLERYRMIQYLTFPIDHDLQIQYFAWTPRSLRTTFFEVQLTMSILEDTIVYWGPTSNQSIQE